MPITADLLELLVCIESREPLVYVPARGSEPEVLFCPASRLVYPFDSEGGFPVLLEEEARRASAAEAAALLARADD